MVIFVLYEMLSRQVEARVCYRAFPFAVYD